MLYSEVISNKTHIQKVLAKETIVINVSTRFTKYLNGGCWLGFDQHSNILRKMVWAKKNPHKYGTIMGATGITFMG